jgi:predicted PurR-regulated permease PerM
VLLVVATVLVALVVKPFIGALFTAAVFATVLKPWQERLSKKLGGHPRLSAAAITLTVLLVVFVPLALVVGEAGRQIVGGVSGAIQAMERDGSEGLIKELPEGLKRHARRIAKMLPTLEVPAEMKPDPEPKAPPRDPPKGSNQSPESGVPGEEDGEESSIVSSKVASAISKIDVGAVVLATANVTKNVATWLIGLAIDIGVMLVALFFLLAQGTALVRWVADVVPLPRQQTASFVDELRAVTLAVFASTVLAAVIQTGIAAVGYLIAGTPMLLMLMLFTFIGAFTPVVGAATIVVLAGALTLASGDSTWGIYLILWGLLPVALCDNVLKPMLAQSRLHLPGSVLFFAMLGGLALMGPMGVIAGPLILSFFIVVLRTLKERKNEESDAIAGIGGA